ncbi:MAG: N-acetyltransferase [Gammaproteobacteria bacterium]|jgi:predicted N-acyltransferase|nr:MAG: N-acetyltransferase [Gammaproteobacteria bacterium]
MELKILTAIADVEAGQWNALAGTGNPFLRHEFLAALERNGCVGEQHGWIPRHLAAIGERGQLLGAVPLYLKDNSYGEFVFDWAWADAYQRNGLSYYPKAVVAVPYTPATGPRLLIAENADRQFLSAQLIQLAQEWSRAERLSSLHWLFTDPLDTQTLEQSGLMLRLGCQFHWRNQGYRDFDDYLDSFSSRKRKKVRRERRYVSEQDIELRVVHGHQASDEQLQVMSDFYRTTFEKKWGYPTLNLAFFRDLAANMGDQLVFFIAYKQQTIVAGAICLRSADTLYGRHWGCYQDYHSLHFEACYYQGIDYCISHGLKTFEPGAQGEHKISRGFLPTPTWSAHWIAHQGFREIIGRFLQQETGAMRDYMEDLSGQSPFKENQAA